MGGNGSVGLTANDDTFTNAGTFSADTDSDFGGGDDTFSNSGTLAISGAAPVTFAGLETSTNSGTVSLADGVAGGNVVIAGNFVGTEGARIAINVDFGNGIADVVTINGAATGVTTINPNLIGETPETMTDAIRAVDAGQGGSADAFVVDNSGENVGLCEFGLAFDSTNNDYLLSATPTAAARETAVVAETIRAAWQRSSDAWSQQMLSQRDTIGKSANGARGDRGFSGWLTAYGSDTLRFGITGGAQNNEVFFAESPNSFDYDVLSIGAYVAFDSGPFFANLLGKYDNIDGMLFSPGGDFTSDVNGSTFGATASAGALFG